MAFTNAKAYDKVRNVLVRNSNLSFYLRASAKLGKYNHIRPTW